MIHYNQYIISSLRSQTPQYCYIMVWYSVRTYESSLITLLHTHHHLFHGTQHWYYCLIHSVVYTTIHQKVLVVAWGDALRNKTCVVQDICFLSCIPRDISLLFFMKKYYYFLHKNIIIFILIYDLNKLFMKKWYFNIFVEKLLKRKWKLIYLETIEEILVGVMWENYSRPKAYKLVHTAKNKGLIISLKKDLYYIPHHNEQETDIIEQYYRDILHDHIKTYTDNKWLLTWLPALQLLLQNYEIPDTIQCITPNKQCIEVVVRDKKIAMKKMTAEKESLYNTLKYTAKKITVRNKSFLCTSLTISLMEALYANNENLLITQEMAKKILKKYRKQIDRDEIITLLRKWKYHSSINKLYHISRSLNDEYPKHIMDIIKKHSYRISI